MCSTRNTIIPAVTDMRLRAEERMKDKTPDADLSLTSESMHRYIHELQVHQIELELQNDELRRTQEELTASLAHLDAIFRSVSDSIIMVDNKGCLVHFNETAGNSWGFTRDLIGSTLADINLVFCKFFSNDLLGVLSTPHKLTNSQTHKLTNSQTHKLTNSQTILMKNTGVNAGCRMAIIE